MTEPHDVELPVAGRGTRGPGCRIFGIVRADWRPQQALDGVGGHPLRLVAAGGIAAVVCDGDAEPAAADLPPGAVRVESAGTLELLAHEAVVEQLARSGTVLPVAPGSRAPRESALGDWLAAAGPSIRSLLDRLEGRCEVGVLGWWDASRPVEPAVPGLAPAAPAAPAAAERAALIARLARDPMTSTYLGRRALRAHEVAAAAEVAERLAQRLHERLAAAAEAARRSGPPRLDVLLDATYLLARARLPELDATLAEVGASCGATVTLRRSGPRVPWHFATLRPFTADARRWAAAMSTGGTPAAAP